MLRAVLTLVAMVCVNVNIGHGYTIKAPGSLGEPPRLRKSWGRQHLLRMGKRSEGGWPSGREVLGRTGRPSGEEQTTWGGGTRRGEVTIWDGRERCRQKMMDTSF